ncbi:MAG: CoB--CoM heterodisulfide reductase iron-sulfur subunit B family protein [Syntrophobacteraceae bacterium]
MKYFYYPGCSLEGSAREYDISTRAMMTALHVELVEIEDWTCCGASAAETQSYLLSMALPARNLALAAGTGIEADMLVPCSSCYLNLKKVEEKFDRDLQTSTLVSEVLAAEGLTYSGGIKIRHLLDILSTDIGPEKIAVNLKRTLSGLKIAPYYGCQALRPYGGFDDPEQPVSMEPLIRALGAGVHKWSMGAKCCGAGLMTTKKEMALGLVAAVLEAAQGADCIVTVCPMCQMNLEIYQGKISKIEGKDLRISVLYLPQLIGLGLGLAEDDLRLDFNFAFTSPFRESLRSLPNEKGESYGKENHGG